MRVGVVSLVLVAVLAGCISEKPEPLAPEPGPLQVDDSNVTAPVNLTATPQGRVYRMDVRDLAFENEMLRTTIVADETLNVTVLAESLVGGSHHDDGCAAVAMTTERDGQAGSNVALVTFYGENDMPISVRAGDDELVVQGDGTETAATFGVPASLTHNFTVPAGGRIHLELGGRDPSFLQTPAQSFSPDAADGTRLWLEVNVTGRSHLEPAASSPIRCGMGPRQFENVTLGASAWFTHGVVGGGVGLDTMRGSSLLWIHGVPYSEPDVAFQFLNQTYPYQPMFAMTHPRTGHIGIEASTWVEPIWSAGWFLGDVHWPVLARVATD